MENQGKRERRIAVTGGGTAGHILPALEFLECYRREFGAAGYFIGCAAGMESRLVPAHGMRLETIPGLPWARQNWLGKMRAVLCLPAAVHAARRILRREKTELVIGAGGYASFGAAIAAYSMGIPVAIHEANAAPGLANRILGRIAALVSLASVEAAWHFRRPVLVTGVPYGAIKGPGAFAGPPWRFVVLGGSEGSPLLNREAPRVFAELRRRGVDFSVRHLAGLLDPRAVAQAYAAAGVTARVDGFVDDVAPVYAEASMALASAGARTLAELAAAGIPSVIVPLPGAARNHQAMNARLYAAQTGAHAVLESPFDAPAVAAHMAAWLAHPDELRRLGSRAAACSQPHAARQLVRACEGVLEARQKVAAGKQLGAGAESYSG